MTDITAASVAVVIPVYLQEIDGLELFSLQYSLRNLDPKREIFFVCPRSLDVSFYLRLAPNAKFATFDDGYFTSIASYCRLLLNPHFYQRFSAYEFMLLTQPDAIIIKDELDYWCTQEYDYIGAPWDPSQPVALRTPDGRNKVVKIGVGNGGLSFRRNRKCIELLNEFPEANEGGVNSEDLFFSVYGFQSKNFSIPSRFVASRFSLEWCPDFFYELNSNYLPMGSHAWWKYDPEFWFKRLYPDLEPMRDLALQGYAKSIANMETNNQLYLKSIEARAKEYINKALDEFGEMERRGQSV